MENTPDKNPESQSRDRMLALYEAAPYSGNLEGRPQQNSLLLSHWINAVNGFAHPVLAADSRILVAGCGSGTEAFMLAGLYPQASIVGIDFSERSIAIAKELAQNSGVGNVQFEVADLMSADWLSRYSLFDFILCHGVADYVLDPSLLLQNLISCLSVGGVIYMMVNSPYHPAGRIREAFARLGIPPEDFKDSPNQRALLQLVAHLMGTDAKLPDLGNAPKAYLDVDIFPSIAHHDSIETWVQRAQEAGLCFAGSMDAPLGLLAVSDAGLPLLYALNKVELSIWMAKIYQRPGIQLLFSRQKQQEPSFVDMEAFWQWKPRLDTCLGMLPDLEIEGDPNKARHITLRFEGVMDFVIYSTAYDLAVLRRCDGMRSLAEIRADIAAEGDLDSLRACLFRAYHYGLLSS